MSPAPTAAREQNAGQSAPPTPFTSLDRLLEPPKEIVVDWQMPSDVDRR